MLVVYDLHTSAAAATQGIIVDETIRLLLFDGAIFLVAIHTSAGLRRWCVDVCILITDGSKNLAADTGFCVDILTMRRSTNGWCPGRVCSVIVAFRTCDVNGVTDTGRNGCNKVRNRPFDASHCRISKSVPQVRGQRGNAWHMPPTAYHNILVASSSVV